MATPRWRQSTALVDQLLSSPHRFGFFQAVRLLQHYALQEAAADKYGTQPIGTDCPPEKEAIKFQLRQSMSFSGADISQIEQKSPYKFAVTTDVLSLTGVNGALPFHFSELSIRQTRSKDPTLQNFLEMLNHRTLGLFYRAWQKYRAPLVFEQQQLLKQTTDTSFSASLAALSGVALGEKASLGLDENLVLGFAGILGRQVKSGIAVQTLLQQLFGLDAKIEEFIPDVGRNTS